MKKKPLAPDLECIRHYVYPLNLSINNKVEATEKHITGEKNQRTSDSFLKFFLSRFEIATMRVKKANRNKGSDTDNDENQYEQ